MISIEKFRAVSQGNGGNGKTYNQNCEVVGVTKEGDELMLVVIVREGGMAFAKTVDFVELPEPTSQQYSF